MEKRNNVDKDSFDGLHINQNWIWKKLQKVEENDNETIATLTGHEGTKIRLKDNKSN